MPKFVSQDRIQQGTLEQISDIPVPQGSGGARRGLHSFLAGWGSTAFCGADFQEIPQFHPLRSSNFSQDKAEQHRVEQMFETAAISLTEEIREVPHIQTRERSSRSLITQQVANTRSSPGEHANASFNWSILQPCLFAVLQVAATREVGVVIY